MDAQIDAIMPAREAVVVMLERGPHGSHCCQLDSAGSRLSRRGDVSTSTQSTRAALLEQVHQ